MANLSAKSENLVKMASSPLEGKSEAPNPEPFEGPEKLLEVWFVSAQEIKNSTAGKTDGKLLDLKTDESKGKLFLRSVGRKRWEEVLKLVRCSILSDVNNGQFDAYLLSESSLFVWPQKVILKTCGTTTLLLALPSILEIAKEVGLSVVGDVFYSRRNYFFQGKQLPPHSSFEDETKFLDGIFEGSAYVLGKKNSDHWYLYLTDGDELIDNSEIKEGQVLPTVNLSKSIISHEPDFTLEVLMTDLDEEVMKQFYKKSGITSKTITETSGIAGLFPHALVDDYLFDPCGYSLNGLLGDGYFTIHVTPQSTCSYVSFETNIQCDYPALMERILKVFKPQRFTATLFGGHISKDAFTKMLQTTLSTTLLDGLHSRRTFTRYEFENNYELAFGHYESGQQNKHKKRKLE